LFLLFDDSLYLLQVTVEFAFFLQAYKALLEVDDRTDVMGVGAAVERIGDFARIVGG
jgi:hypothetical protein